MLLIVRSRRTLAFILSAHLAVMSLVGCGTQPQPKEKHYPLEAEVIAIDLPRKFLLVKHGDIPGFMPAMAMSYTIAVPKEAATLAPGDKISADLVVSEGRGRLERIVLLERVKPNQAPPPAAASE